MKKLYFFVIALMMVTLLPGCGTENKVTDNPQNSEIMDSDASAEKITKEMAYEGVFNYCHSVYDWSIAENNPDIMYLQMGKETESEYQVIFSSYTGAFVYFYVDKSSGTTRITEYVPILDLEEDAGTIDLYHYLNTGTAE